MVSTPYVPSLLPQLQVLLVDHASAQVIRILGLTLDPSSSSIVVVDVVARIYPPPPLHCSPIDKQRHSALWPSGAFFTRHDPSPPYSITHPASTLCCSETRVNP